jgi:hypothetical protein
MKKIITIIGFGLIITGASAQEKSPFSYNSISAGYQSGTINLSTGTNWNTTGFSFGGTAAINDSMFLGGSLANGTAKRNGVSVDQNAYSFGLGGHTALSNQTDLVGSASYISSRASIYGYSYTVTGLGFDLGLRHALTEKLEINGGVGLTILGSDRTQTSSANIGLRYKLADKFSIGVNYTGSNSDGGTSQGVMGILRVDL